MPPRKNHEKLHSFCIPHPRTNRARLEALLGLFGKEDDVLIVINADPDALASAMALRRLLRYRAKSVVIGYPNEIRRMSNMAMVELLKIPIERLHTLKPEQFSKKVIIDSQPGHHPSFEKLHFDAVIDHHPLTTGCEADYVDIRPDYGATASMLVEYLRTAGVTPSVPLATALIYAIKVDTQNFEKKAKLADAISFRYLFDIANMNLVRKIELSTLRRSELNYFKTALAEMTVSKKRLYVHIGSVPSPDVLVLIADFLNMMREVEWTLVSGIHNEKLVVIFRCDGYRKNAGKLAQQIFAAMGSAGGHREMARAEVPVKNLALPVKEFSTQVLKRLATRHMQ